MKQLFTEKEYEEKYNIIKNILIESNKKSIFPLAALVGGQPGSGKSQLAKFIMKENPNTINIDGDYIREFHPHLNEIKETFGTDYPKITQPFVNRTVEQLIDELSKEKYNLIIEGTLRDINVPRETALTLNERDYMVELYVVATNKDLSWKSTIDRGDKMKSEGKTPRYVDKSHHDQVVERLPDTIKDLSKDDLFFNIIIMNREQEILYDKNKNMELNPKEIMEHSLDGEPVMSVDDIQREIDRLEKMKSSIGKNMKKDIHRNNFDLNR